MSNPARCAWCHSIIVLDEFAARLPDGRLLCTNCKTAHANGRGLSAVADALMWIALIGGVVGIAFALSCCAGCRTPPPGDGRFGPPWQGESPINPPGWTNAPPECPHDLPASA